MFGLQIPVGFQKPELLLLIVPALLIIFFLTKADLVRFRSRKDKEEYNHSKKWLRIMVFILRTFAVFCLILALAQPFIMEKKVTEGNPQLKILLDKSKSFDIFDKEISEGMKDRLSVEIPAFVRTIGAEDKSAIGDALLENMEGDDSLLLISDGNNNYGKELGSVALFAAMINTTINVLDVSPIRDDARISIAGPKTTTANTENSFDVYVDSIGKSASYNIVVTVDGEEVINQNLEGPQQLTFKKSFTSGYHEIGGEIKLNDYFPENNVFYKTVKVEPKPRVLLVADQSSPLSSVLSSLYELKTEKEIPADISQYSAVVVDDKKMAALNVNGLRDYTLNGNGLVVFGGKNSFDKDNYKDASFKPYEALLPVTVGAGKPKEKKEVNVVIVIDISGSTGQSFSKSSSNSIEDVEKALAISVLNDLRKDDNVAILAFNTNSYVVSDFSKLTNVNIPELEDKITKLNFGGGTLISAGIEKAVEILENTEGSKNIILISDGNTGGLPWDEVREAEGAAVGGIRIYTIGVGASTDAQHMKDIADAGNGVYFEPEEEQTIKIIFGSSEEQEKKEMNRLEVIDSHHFITSKLPLNAEISGFNFVIPKQSATLLVATGQNNPVVTVWRFGLGRIAVVSTDDGNAWADQLYSTKSSLLVAKTVNWAVGDLSRNKEFDVDMKDAYLGEPIEINVKSKSPPSYKDLNFTKTGDNTYLATDIKSEPGFYSYFDGTVAVNYQREINNLGVNPELQTMASITNGQAFKPDQIQEIIEKVRQDSKVIKIETISYAWAFLAAALGIFLLEVAIRRIAENKSNK